MKILVTGAAGFIGSAVAERLTQQGNAVTAVDSFSDYYSQDLKRNRAERLSKLSGLNVLETDLSEELSVVKLFEKSKPDLVIHLAAQPGVRLPISENHRYVKDNLVAFSNIASQSCIANVDSFLYASSSSVYGNNNSTSLSENINGIKPISFYGATKLANEILANSLALSSATKFRGLRFFTVYGPWGRPDMAYLKIINAALNKKSFELFGDGSKTRDFTYVDDVVSSVVNLGSELLSRKSGFSDVVNIGGGQPISMNNLIDTIQKELNMEIEVKRGQDASGDVFATNANTEYLKSLMPSKNFVNIHEGIKEVVKWAVTCNDQNQFENWVS